MVKSKRSSISSSSCSLCHVKPPDTGAAGQAAGGASQAGGAADQAKGAGGIADQAKSDADQGAPGAPSGIADQAKATAGGASSAGGIPERGIVDKVAGAAANVAPGALGAAGTTKPGEKVLEAEDAAAAAEKQKELREYDVKGARDAADSAVKTADGKGDKGGGNVNE